MMFDDLPHPSEFSPGHNYDPANSQEELEELRKFVASVNQFDRLLKKLLNEKMSLQQKLADLRGHYTYSLERLEVLEDWIKKNELVERHCHVILDTMGSPRSNNDQGELSLVERLNKLASYIHSLDIP